MSTTIPARIGDLWAFFVDLMDCDGFFFLLFFLLFSLWIFGGFLLGDFMTTVLLEDHKVPDLTRYLGRERYTIGTCRY